MTSAAADPNGESNANTGTPAASDKPDANAATPAKTDVNADAEVVTPLAAPDTFHFETTAPDVLQTVAVEVTPPPASVTPEIVETISPAAPDVAQAIVPDVPQPPAPVTPEITETVTPETPAPTEAIALDQEAPFQHEGDASPATATPATTSTPSALGSGPVILKLAGITRQRGTATAAIDLDVRQGEIVVLLGDNGSGKTTLARILAGDDFADHGEVHVARQGKADSFDLMRQGSYAAALAAGIGVVRSAPPLAPSLTGLQNIVVGVRSFWRLTLNRRALREELNALRRRLELPVDIDVPVATLPGGARVQIDLLRAAFHESRIVVLDEPTAALTPQETTVLFKALRLLAADGAAVILTTRRPEEAMAAADRIVVLRDGHKLAELAPRKTDTATLAALITGRAIVQAAPTPRSAEHEVISLSLAEAPGFGTHPPLQKVSLTVRAGEIIGIAGTPLNGQDTLVAVLTGVVAPTAGKITLFGRAPRECDPALFLRAGVGKAPADSRRHAFVGEMSIAENLMLESVDDARFTRNGLLNRRAMREHAAEVIAAYGVDCPSPNVLAETLSESKLRKLALARMLDRKPHLVIAHDSTLGLDLAERSEVHRRLVAEREDGAAVLLISDDLDELLLLSDYIGVLHRGHLSVPQPAGAFDKQTLGLMMGGHGSLAQDWSGWGGGT